MKKLVSKVVILAVISLAMFASAQTPWAGHANFGGKASKTGKPTGTKKYKVDSGVQNKKTMEDTFGTIKPLSSSGSAKADANTVIWDGQKVTIRSGQVFNGFVLELSYGTIGACSNTYLIKEGSTGKIVFSESEKDAYCETFRKIGEEMERAKTKRAKSFTKSIPCSVDGVQFVFEWTSKPIASSNKNALEIPKTIDSCRVVFTKTDLVTKNVLTGIFNKPEMLGEFLKILTSKDRDIVVEFNKRNGTPSDAEKNSK
jgi:hypothetical protein